MTEYETVSKSVKIDIIDGLKDRLPQIFEDGKVNLEKLKALLTGEIIEKEDDRFYFNWAGKSKLFKLIQEPGYGTLKPDKERSIDFDNTENMVIVGENLETLKLLLKPYFGKVKMIYIDPPYNTGNDFIYRDNFKEPLKDYLEKTGQIDREGSKLTTNTEASGRYHSDWLNFMYPRLFLARSLLRDDGVIFVSIDDNEVHNLRKIMDEIFGEECFKNSIIFRRGIKSVQAQFDTVDSLTVGHEYVVMYAKSPKARFKKLYIPLEEAKEGTWNNHWRGTDRPTMRYELFGIIPTSGQWRWSKERSLKAIEKYERMLKELKVEKDNITQQQIDEWYQKECEKVGEEIDLLRLSSTGKPEHYVPPTETKLGSDLWMDLSSRGSGEVQAIFGCKVFDNPKPVGLVKRMLEFITTPDEDDIILDFFAGSGTTGHAVWDLNKEDEGNRRFILVNLDEVVQDENIKKDYSTVADICIERLKKVSEKYRKEEQQKLINNDHDFGFKVFKLDKSNFNLKDEFDISEEEDVEELKKKYLEWLGLWINEPLVGDWKPIDIVYETMLKEGFDLNSKIEEKKIKGKKFSHVTDEKQELEFYMSLDEKITEGAIEEIRTPEYRDKAFVFLDKALSDNDKINLSAFVRLKVI
jgi:adenine-specific DNA-methyltransferase